MGNLLSSGAKQPAQQQQYQHREHNEHYQHHNDYHDHHEPVKVVHHPTLKELKTEVENSVREQEELREQEERNRQRRLKLEQEQRQLRLQVAENMRRMKLFEEKRVLQQEAEAKRRIEYELAWPSLNQQQQQQHHPLTAHQPPLPRPQHNRGGSYVDFWEDWEDSPTFNPGSNSDNASMSTYDNDDVDLGEWRKARAANSKKGCVEGRRIRGRKPRGDLTEFDYHAGHTKEEILSMCRERQANFEVQAMRRANH
ncbi:hypothetical protein BGZ83_006177 [Gryganskiella cystojenkinii]|nr:hypothetical protein BGZ83_006177 [Gryganskiella cystojenkinii]